MHFLEQRGISSMVFEYAGSESAITSFISRRQDARVAYQAFISRVPSEAKKYLLGISSGAASLLQISERIDSDIDGVFIIAPFTSSREAVSCLNSFPSWLSFLLPNPYNNINQVINVQRPLILIHSVDDEIFPVRMSERLYQAAREPKLLVLLHGLRHREILEDKEAQYLAPVADMIAN